MTAPVAACSRPWPETWSACVWVSSTWSISTPRNRASRRYSLTSTLGSTTAATPARSSPMRYDAQPRSSWMSWRKITLPPTLSRHGDAVEVLGGRGEPRVHVLEGLDHDPRDGPVAVP